jgi:hypothetical protein
MRDSNRRRLLQRAGNGNILDTIDSSSAFDPRVSTAHANHFNFSVSIAERYAVELHGGLAMAELSASYRVDADLEPALAGLLVTH